MGWGLDKPAGRRAGRSAAADVANRLLRDYQGDYSPQIKWASEGTLGTVIMHKALGQILYLSGGGGGGNNVANMIS